MLLTLFPESIQVKMPEGPSIVILRENTADFAGKRVRKASGNAKKIDFDRMTGQKIEHITSWGKHYLISFGEFTIRIHFLLFGTWRINERKDTVPRLQLQFEDGELNFYTCSVKLLEGPPEDHYDWSTDVLSEKWDEKQALQKLREHPERLVCDVLLDQDIFTGVGNIIKNEVLFRTGIHPESQFGALPAAKQRALVREAVKYSFDFLEWKKAGTLKAHWKVHTRKECPDGKEPVIKKYCGKTNRRTYFCEKVQKLYSRE